MMLNFNHTYGNLSERKAVLGRYMSKSIKLIIAAQLILLMKVPLTIGSVHNSSQELDLPSPAQLWERCQKTLPPFKYDILSDEVITSDTDPALMLRKITVSFISQEILGATMGHQAVILMPSDPFKNRSLTQPSKVVIVTGRYGDATIIRNYGEPISARTGYATMSLVLPGDKNGGDGEMFWLQGLRKLASESQDPINHDLFRSAVPYLQAVDILSDVLKSKEIRAIIGGHSKRAYYAYTAAAIDPDRIAGVVYMGCERLFDEEEKYPDLSVSPLFKDNEKYPRSLVLFTTQQYVKCPVLYLGATNEAGYTMFNINKLQARMKQKWIIEYIPNYRHASNSEKQFLDWQMWVSHVFDERPLTRINNLKHSATENGTVFNAQIDTPNTIMQVKAWYVHCDDVPYWRDLVWYPTIMRHKQGNIYEGRVGGNIPDAWLVEVKDIAQGFPGYISSLPQDITHKPAEERYARQPRNWKLKIKR